MKQFTQKPTFASYVILDDLSVRGAAVNDMIALPVTALMGKTI